MQFLHAYANYTKLILILKKYLFCGNEQFVEERNASLTRSFKQNKANINFQHTLSKS